MRRLILLPLAIALSSLIPFAAFGQTSVATDPVGFTTVSCLGNSDTFVSVPFTRPSEFVGAIASAAGSTITVSGTPWVANQFVYVAGTQPKHYYALIGPGTSNPKEGHIYFVSGNGANTLTVDTTQDNLTGIVPNTQILVIPYWTPATLFPASDANVSFTPTTLTTSFKTRLLIPDYAASGINLPYSPIYFFSNNVNGTTNNVGWRVFPNIMADRGDDPLLPDGYMVVRHENGAPTLPLTSKGGVLTKKLAVPLITSASQKQDNAVSMVRPVDVALNDTGLTPSDGSFVATPPVITIGNRFPRLKDQLLLFDNTQVGFNKSPSATYYYTSGPLRSIGWKLFGDGLADHGNDLVPAGSAIVIRKAITASGQTTFWTNSPTY
jgi:uncharacterized protein (TIGR02597 family)